MNCEWSFVKNKNLMSIFIVLVYRVNGFDYWYVIRENKLVSINEIRELYREHLSKESI